MYFCDFYDMTVLVVRLIVQLLMPDKLQSLCLVSERVIMIRNCKVC